MTGKELNNEDGQNEKEEQNDIDIPSEPVVIDHEDDSDDNGDTMPTNEHNNIDEVTNAYPNVEMADTKSNEEHQEQ